MNPKSLRLFTAGVVAAAAALCWYLLDMAPERAARSAGKVPASISGQGKAAGKLPVSPAQPAEPWEALHVRKLEGAVAGGTRKWLNDRGRDAAGLIAQWKLTGNGELLTEAAQKFPGDPRVCRAMISQTRGDAKKALPWIERLTIAEPRNPEGFYLKAWALNVGGDRAAALPVLRKAGTICGIAEGQRQEEYRLMEEAARAGGAGDRDAPLLALRASRQHSLMQTAVEGMNATVRAELAEAKSTNSEERLLVIAGLGFTAASNLASLPGLSMKDEMEATSLEMEIFAALPADAEFGEGGRTTAALKQQTEGRRAHIVKTLTAAATAGDFLLHAGHESVSGYAGCFMTYDEASATSFALSQLPAEEEEP